MSSTNKTTNYELTQFLATDVPSWLVDYNGDMLKIDTQMKVNATAAAAAQNKADGADSKADTNAADIDTLEAALNTPSTGLVARVSDVEGDVDTIESLIGNGSPTTTDKTLIGAINELDGDIGTLDGKVDTVEDKVDLLGNRRFVLIGDSYLQGATYHEGGAWTYDTTPWGTYFCNILGLDPATVPMLAVGGAGFAAQTDQGTWPSRFPAFAETVTDPDTVTDVIIAGGINDAIFSNRASVVSGIVSMGTLVRAAFPNAKIHIAYIGVDKFDVSSQLKSYEMRDTYALTAAQGPKMTYLADCEFVLQELEFLQADGVHPNSVGNNFLACALVNAIFGNSIEVPSTTYDYTLTSAAMSNTINLKGVRKGEFAQLINKTSQIISLTSAVTGEFNGSSVDIELATIPASASFIYGQADTNGKSFVQVTVPAFFYTDNAGTPTNILGMAVVCVVNGKLKVRPIAVDPTTGAYVTGDMDTFVLPAFTITFDTLLS